MTRSLSPLSHPRFGRGLATLAALTAAWFACSSVPAAAAEVRRTVVVDIVSAAEVVETTSIEIDFEDAGDIERLGVYPIALDEHRQLESLEAYAVDPRGKKRKVRRRQRDEVEGSGASWILHDSARYVLLAPDQLVPGSRLVARFVVRETPYFPAGRRSLEPLEEDTLQLDVTVRAAPGVENWRWRVGGLATDPTSGLHRVEGERSIRLHGRLASRLDAAADRATATRSALAADSPAELLYGWHLAGSWQQVGRWYRDLVAQVPRGGAPVAARAADLAVSAAGGEASQVARTRLEAAVAFVRSEVRYVAVEIGIGGFRPSAPAETLERRWGDCKDKSLLLIDLLAEAGIEAYPALIQLGESRRIEPDFPSPGQFNHLIVAVPASQIAARSGDPVAEGHFFIDPTQTTGGARYLHTAVQDQQALVIGPEGSELVRVPSLPTSEGRALRLSLDLSTGDRRTAGGDVAERPRGEATYRLRGGDAASWARQSRNRSQLETQGSLRSLFKRLLPTVQIEDVSWTQVAEDLPEVELRATVSVADPALAWSLPEGLRVTPEPREIDALEEAGAAVVPARETVVEYRLKFGDSLCPPADRDDRVETAVGHFVRTVGQEDGWTVIRRSGRIDRPWIDGVDRAALRELSVAEHRALRRRLRSSC